MKNLTITFSICLIALLFSYNAQTQNIWKGGTPGNETNWDNPKNWSQNQIPDWSENVIIPDVSNQSGHFPVISQVIEAIPHIQIQSNAKLTVLPTGRLVIDGETTNNCGILLNGQLISNGNIDIVNVAHKEIDQKGGEMVIGKVLLAGN